MPRIAKPYCADELRAMAETVREFVELVEIRGL